MDQAEEETSWLADVEKLSSEPGAPKAVWPIPIHNSCELELPSESCSVVWLGGKALFLVASFTWQWFKFLTASSELTSNVFVVSSGICYFPH